MKGYFEMNKIKVGITAKNFYLWAGGIDFIATVAQGLETCNNIELFLLLKNDTTALKLIKRILFVFKSKGSYKKYKEMVNTYRNRYSSLIELFKLCCPNTKIITYRGSYVDDDYRIMSCLKKYKIDILLPHNGYFKSDTPIPWVGYMYDFQHEYFPDLFTKRELLNRKKELIKRIKYSKYIIVNANSVKVDVLKFYPQYKGKIFVLPFAPFQKPVLNENISLVKYNLPKKYYMIANQFWKHKNHLTAFEALEKTYKNGQRDIHIVCSGKMEDSRNPEYIDKLMASIETMQCKDNIHLLGYIPKEDQILIMKRAIGLVQPTLCEGGPGGGAVYNALCLGITCLVSDIPINREIFGYKNVYFFQAENADQLANLLISHSNDQTVDDGKVEKKILENRRLYSNTLLEFIDEIL